MPSDPRCNCMVLFDPVLPPGEHADDCPLRHGVMEFRSRDPRRPHESDEAWTRDREEALDEVEAFHALGADGYQLDARIVLDG
jgi:hypothetical protein